MNLTETFLNFALSTGAQWVMILLLLCSVLSIALIFDRFFFLSKNKGDFPLFIKTLTERLNSNEPAERTAAWCSGQNLLESSVAAVGLEKVTHSRQAAEDAMAATLMAAKIRMEKGLIVLGTLGNNTPFLGLFGTIIGVIEAFHHLSLSAAAGSEAIMASIAEALVSTALGILVAIPAVVFYNFFHRQIKKRVAQTEAAARIILSRYS